MKRFFKGLALCLLLLPCLVMFSACDLGSQTENPPVVSVVDIVKSDSNGEYDIYIIKYSDGREEPFTVKNGTNSTITVQDLYLAAKEAKGLGDEYTLLDFIGEYLSFNVEDKVEDDITQCCFSTVAVNAVFPMTQNVLSGSSKLVLGAGSGVIYQPENSQDYYVITNYHVVYYSSSSSANKIASEIKVFPYGATISATPVYDANETYIERYQFGSGAIDCEYIGGSVQYDIAVLKVKEPQKLIASGAKVAKIANMDKVAIGEDIYAVGNPEGLGMSVTKGVVNVDSENISITLADDTPGKMRVLRIDAAVNSGNSGGGAYNAKGELIGIVNAKMTVDQVENIGYAIPANVAVIIANKAIEEYESDGTVDPLCKVLLGITYTTQNGKATYNSETTEIKLTDELWIESTEETGICYEKLFKGDIIRSVSIKGETYEIDRAFKLGDLLWKVEKGDVITFGVERQGNIVAISVIATEESLNAV